MNRPLSQNELSVAPEALTAEWKRIAELSELEIAEWRDLMTRALEPNVFLDPDFARAAVQLPGQDAGAVLVRSRQHLVGLFPGKVEGFSRGRVVNIFVGWTHPFAPLYVPFVDRDMASEAIAKFLAFLPSVPGTPRLALFPLLNEKSETVHLIGQVLISRGVAKRRLNVHQRAAFSPEAGERISISAKKMKELRRQRRRLEEAGDLTRATVSSPDGIEATLTEYLALESRGWKGQSGGHAKEFMRDAVCVLAVKGKARIDLLRLNGEAIAAAITLFEGHRAWFWKIAYDEDRARYSPGVQLTLDLTESLALDQRISLVDSCATAGHPMIDHLWARRIAMADWLVPLSGSAVFEIGFAAESLRRAAIRVAKAVRNLIR